MTVFSATQKEALHGHNYRVSIEIVLTERGVTNSIPFAEIKEPVRSLCNGWHEKVLVPEKNPHLREASPTTGRFILCGKTYQIPPDELVWLPITNITCEALSILLRSKIMEILHPFFNDGRVRNIIVTVWESEGQGASVHSAFDGGNRGI